MGLISAYLFMAASSNWLWLLVLLVGLSCLYMRTFVAVYDTSTDRTDTLTFLVTGAESGIGKMTVDLLAARGGRVIMACKDVTLGQAAKDQIVKRTGNENVEVRHLDLSSLESVRKFAKDIHGSVSKLDVLINNASISCASNTTSADGLNTIMQANHFGPFLLTNLLLDLIKKSSPSRILFVTSIIHHFHKFSLDNLNCDKEPLAGCRVYCNSKLANILTAKHFAWVLQGTGVTVNTVHPGMTEMDPTSSNCSGSVMGMLYSFFLKIFGKIGFKHYVSQKRMSVEFFSALLGQDEAKSVIYITIAALMAATGNINIHRNTLREGAMTSTYAATEPKLKYLTGTHFAECKVSNCVAKIALNRELQEKLFEKSAQLVNLSLEERHL